MSRRGFDPLTYRFQKEEPAKGDVTEIADGVYWIRMPLWGRLNHINVWLLADGDGWTIVDTPASSPKKSRNTGRLSLQIILAANQ